jgi:hypothetical protein
MINKYMDIFSLIKKQEKKKSYKDEVFRKILDQAHRRIKYSSDSGEHYSIFTIPLYVVGYPLFNTSECVDFVISQLSLNGFKAVCYSEKYIYITWEHVYEKYVENKILSKNLLEDLREEPVKQIEDKIKRSNQLIFNTSNQSNNQFSLLK